MYVFPPFSLQTGLLAFFAALVNGGIGYGFSSIITPVALLWTTNQVLNPALVVVELGLNITLLLRERAHIRTTFRRAAPLMVGLLPGVIAGSFALAIIAPTTVKLVVYVVLFPLIALQLIGIRWKIRRETAASGALGIGIGFLYSLTTISGPPLALYWRNAGLAKDEFRCAMAQVRVAEASFTGISYLVLGLYTPASVNLIPVLLIPVIIGIPLGVFLLSNISRQGFLRLVMSLDGIFVSFGLSQVMVSLHWISAMVSYLVFAGLTAAVLLLAYVTVSKPQGVDERPPSSPASEAGLGPPTALRPPD